MDGVPLTEVDAQWYRSQIGVVAQDPRLFSNTITANITYGCTGKSQVRRRLLISWFCLPFTLKYIQAASNCAVCVASDSA